MIHGQLHRKTEVSMRVLLRNVALLTSIAAILFMARPASPYLQQIQGSAAAPVNLRWDFSAFPVQWNLNPGTSSAKISGDRSPADVITASFQTWLSAPNIALNVSRGPDTNNSPGVDGVNLICFVCTGAFTKACQTLAVTVRMITK